MGQVFSTNNNENDNALTRSYAMVNGATPEGAGNSKKRKYHRNAEKNRQLLLNFLVHVELQTMQDHGVALPEAVVKKPTFCDEVEESALNVLASKLDCGNETVAFVRDQYAKCANGRDGLFAHFKKIAEEKNIKWDLQVALKDRAEFFTAAIQLFLSRNYTKLDKLFEEKKKKVLMSCVSDLHNTSHLLDLMFLYCLLKYYASQESEKELQKYLEKMPGRVHCKIDEKLQFKLLQVIFWCSDKSVCANIKNVLSPLSEIADISWIIIGMCEEVELDVIGMTSSALLKEARNRLLRSWKLPTDQLGFVIADIRRMLNFYDRTFCSRPAGTRLLLEFFLNPCEDTFEELEEFCLDDLEDVDVWEDYEAVICEELINLFDAGVDIIFGQKKSQRLGDIFMLAFRMNTINVVDRFKLLDTILNRIEETFLPKEIEQLCFLYLHRDEPKSQREIVLAHRVIRLLKKTDLKSRHEMISMLDDDIEEAITKSPKTRIQRIECTKTRIQRLEQEIRDLKACRRKELLCPIGYEIMFDPVTIECGHAFERFNILKHFSLSTFNSCPTCRVYVNGDVINECQPLRSMALPYLKTEQERLKDIFVILDKSLREVGRYRSASQRHVYERSNSPSY